MLYANDTIKIKHCLKVLENYDFQKTWKKLSDIRGITWINNPKNKKTLPRLSIFQTPDNVWHITAEVSLPRLLFGHNARLPNEHETFEGLKIIGEYVEEKSGLPFNPFSATVSRVDFTLDIQLTEPEVIELIRKLSAQKLRRLRKIFFDDETICFETKNKEKIIRIYGKFLEVLSRKNSTLEEKECAKGKLRIECSLQGYQLKALIKRLALPDNSVLSVLNADVSNKVISEILESLNFEEIRTNEKTIFAKLSEVFSPKRAEQLFGFLGLVNHYGLNFYKDKSLNYSESTYKRKVALCQKAKVWKHIISFE
jgi:hypothetical protein